MFKNDDLRMRLGDVRNIGIDLLLYFFVWVICCDSNCCSDARQVPSLAEQTRPLCDLQGLAQDQFNVTFPVQRRLEDTARVGRVDWPASLAEAGPTNADATLHGNVCQSGLDRQICR